MSKTEEDCYESSVFRVAVHRVDFDPERNERRSTITEMLKPAQTSSLSQGDNNKHGDLESNLQEFSQAARHDAEWKETILLSYDLNCIMVGEFVRNILVNVAHEPVYLGERVVSALVFCTKGCGSWLDRSLTSIAVDPNARLRAYLGSSASNHEFRVSILLPEVDSPLGWLRLNVCNLLDSALPSFSADSLSNENCTTDGEMLRSLVSKKNRLGRLL